MSHGYVSNRLSVSVCLDQPEHTGVGDSMRHRLHGPFVAHVVEETTDVRIEDPVHTLPGDAHMQRVERLMWTPTRPKPIREAPKIHPINLVEDPYNVPV